MRLDELHAFGIKKTGIISLFLKAINRNPGLSLGSINAMYRDVKKCGITDFMLVKNGASLEMLEAYNIRIDMQRFMEDAAIQEKYDREIKKKWVPERARRKRR